MEIALTFRVNFVNEKNINITFCYSKQKRENIEIRKNIGVGYLISLFDEKNLKTKTL